MWKDTLEKRGIGQEALPAKIKTLIADYNEIEAGVVELKNELEATADASEKKSIQSDLKELEDSLGTLGNQIKKAIELLRANPDGTVGQYTASELSQAWEARRQAWLASDKKQRTQSIF